MPPAWGISLWVLYGYGPWYPDCWNRREGLRCAVFGSSAISTTPQQTPQFLEKNYTSLWSRPAHTLGGCHCGKLPWGLYVVARWEVVCVGIRNFIFVAITSFKKSRQNFNQPSRPKNRLKEANLDLYTHIIQENCPWISLQGICAPEVLIEAPARLRKALHSFLLDKSQNSTLFVCPELLPEAVAISSILHTPLTMHMLSVTVIFGSRKKFISELLQHKYAKTLLT